jgi:hypothetical protein
MEIVLFSVTETAEFHIAQNVLSVQASVAHRKGIYRL